MGLYSSNLSLASSAENRFNHRNQEADPHGNPKSLDEFYTAVQNSLSFNNLYNTIAQTTLLGITGDAFSIAGKVIGAKFGIGNYLSVASDEGFSALLTARSRTGHMNFENIACDLLQGLASRAMVEGALGLASALLIPWPIRLAVLVGSMTFSNLASEWMINKAFNTGTNSPAEKNGWGYAFDLFNTSLVMLAGGARNKAVEIGENYINKKLKPDFVIYNRKDSANDDMYNLTVAKVTKYDSDGCVTVETYEYLRRREDLLTPKQYSRNPADFAKIKKTYLSQIKVSEDNPINASNASNASYDTIDNYPDTRVMHDRALKYNSSTAQEMANDFDQSHKRLIKKLHSLGLKPDPSHITIVVTPAIKGSYRSGINYLNLAETDKLFGSTFLPHTNIHPDFSRRELDTVFLKAPEGFNDETLYHELGHHYDPGYDDHRTDYMSEAFADFTSYLMTGKTAVIINENTFRDFAPSPTTSFQEFIRSNDFAGSYAHIHNGSIPFSHIFYSLAQRHGREKIFTDFYNLRKQNLTPMTIEHGKYPKISLPKMQIESQLAGMAANQSTARMMQFLETSYPDMVPYAKTVLFGEQTP